ncbi:hypothetical protein PsorP6_011035 [Peronosclerospora sorghi]|uniref:Uncharacterized protein n=1 Tax=Peronosclerospora sorghi TaxID=230839 RepID=A0ACC0VWH2_9STRA|nr:hypothetical protein PsorP6_011035 [Peronosclerospora sorghi]
MVFRDQVNRAILAMRNSIQEQVLALDIVKSQESKPYAEFGLESRIHVSNNVDWAFSARY